jgi:sigma-54 dependent transcriptional regulator, acetoin dehydrogenase operon transcriptional activator AcoR
VVTLAGVAFVAWCVVNPSSFVLDQQERLTRIAHARRAVLEHQQPGPALGLAPGIERSWRRCLGLGLDPRQRVTFEAISASAMRESIDRSRPLREAASSVLRSLTRAMLHTQHFAILADANGTVIEIFGPVDAHNPHARAIARVGVDLSEAAIGTTAIGTTLADLQPVWLHRGEHFFHDTVVFSCAGAPIFGPDGYCLGMLDLTGVNVPEQPALRHLVEQAARSIENQLVLALSHRLLLRMNWPGRVLGDDSDGLVGVSDDGHLTGMNRSARDMLSLSPTWGRLAHCSDVFAVAPQTLFDAATARRGPMEVPLWMGLRLQVLAQGRVDAHHAHAPQRKASPASHGVPLKDVEAALILKAVEDARGNVQEAARALGISRATVYRKLGKPKPQG